MVSLVDEIVNAVCEKLSKENKNKVLVMVDDLKKENRWVVALLVGVIACMAPLITFHRSEPTEGEIQSSYLDYSISVSLLCSFGYFAKVLYTNALAEYALFLETQNQSESDVGKEDYFWYRLDYLFSNSKSFKIYALGGITVLLIFFGGLFWVAVSDKNLAESIWASWTFIADPGSHGDNSIWTQRIISFLLTIGGMIIFATVIGIISEEFATFVENLKKGKSSVVESGHTIIIGHGDKLIPTIEQICKANESEGGGLIVVLSTLEKEELEDAISQSGVELEGSRVIVRSGSPHLHADLRRVSAESARSIIVLADRNFADPDMTDVATVRTVMCLRGLDAPRTGHIVCEVCDVDNEELITLVGKDHVETVVSHDIIGRLMIQCAREKGLAGVLSELLGFDGSEFYISDWGDQLVGKTFGEVCLLFKDAVVLGIYRAEPEEVEDDDKPVYHGNSEGVNSPDVNAPLRPTNSTVERWNTIASPFSPSRTPSKEEQQKFSCKNSTGTSYTNIAARMFINPSDSEVFKAGDQVIVLAEDNDTYQPEDPMPIDRDRMNSCSSIGIKEEVQKEKMLFIGWRRDMDDMILQVDDLLAQGSDLTIFCDRDMEEREASLAEGGMSISMLNNIHLHHLKGCTTSRKDLEALPLELFDSILILADEELESSKEGGDMLHADSKSLVCLILIRDIQQCIKVAVEGMRDKLLQDIATIPVTSGSSLGLTGTDECSEHESGTGVSAPADRIVMGRKQKLADRRKIIEGLFKPAPGKGADSELSGKDNVRTYSQHVSPILMRRVHETYYNFAIDKIKRIEAETTPTAATKLAKSDRRSSLAVADGVVDTPPRPASVDNIFVAVDNPSRDAGDKGSRGVFNQNNVGDTEAVLTLGCEVDELAVPEPLAVSEPGTPISQTKEGEVLSPKPSLCRRALNTNITVDTGADENVEESSAAAAFGTGSSAAMRKTQSVFPTGSPSVLPPSSHRRRNSSFGPGEANHVVGSVPSATQETRSAQKLMQTVEEEIIARRPLTTHGAGASFFKDGRRDHKAMDNPFIKLKRSNTRRRSALISEILDSRTKNVINLAIQSDYVMSNELVSMVIAMVAEQREVNCVLKELFSGKGNEMHIHPADEYALVDSKLSFAEIMCIARRKHQVAIGYTDEEGVHLNPVDKITPMVWHANTSIVVVYTRKQNISLG